MPEPLRSGILLIKPISNKNYQLKAMLYTKTLLLIYCLLNILSCVRMCGGVGGGIYFYYLNKWSVCHFFHKSLNHLLMLDKQTSAVLLPSHLLWLLLQYWLFIVYKCCCCLLDDAGCCVLCYCVWLLWWYVSLNIFLFYGIEPYNIFYNTTL